jgi:DNA modification methylase
MGEVVRAGGAVVGGGVMDTIELAINDIIWREDLYPRFEPDPSRIQQYAEVVELLPPIEINQRNELIDGYHRWTAHKKAEIDTIQAIVTQTESDIELDRLMAKRNADFGIQLSQEEKKRKAVQWFTLDADKEQIAIDLKVSERTITRWVSRKAKDLKIDRDRKIADMWLACYTEEEIANECRVDQSTINRQCQELCKSDIWQKNIIFSEYQDPDWLPPLYNVWKKQDKTNKTGHFGNSEASFVDRLLYLYTEPFKIVVDPFAGGGSTIDVCKKRLRRYWVSDRLPIVERRDVREWDILEGPPQLHKRWGDVDMLYLDPPYWKQAEGKYSKDSEDLANMELDRFYEVLTGFVRQCAEKMHSGSFIALLISASQWRATGKRVIDHMFDIRHLLIDAPFSLEMKMCWPYESQQYNGNQVAWAKENKQVLVVDRELIVWRVD